MKDLKVVFENISGRFVMAGKTYGEMLFSRVSLKVSSTRNLYKAWP